MKVQVFKKERKKSWTHEGPSIKKRERRDSPCPKKNGER